MARLASGERDAMLTDIVMPAGVTGIDLLRIVRERQLDIPVVLVTGAPAVESAVKALQLGAFHYLMKPLDAESVEDVVARAVRLRRMALMKREAAELLGSGAKRTTHGVWQRISSAR
jgi:DNA-binding NtrC family response regulator